MVQGAAGATRSGGSVAVLTSGGATQAPDRGLPAPDAVLYLGITPQAASTRGEYGEERYEQLDMQAAVVAQFAALRAPWWTLIDAARGVDDVAADVQAAAEAAVARAAAGVPLDRLWDERAA